MTFQQWLITIAGSLCFGAAVEWSVIGLTPYWDTLAGRFMRDRISRCEQLGMDTSKATIGLRLWGAALVVVFCGLWWGLSMPPVACAVTFLVFVMAGYMMDWIIECRTRLLRDQMVAASLSLASAVRASFGVAQGLEVVAHETPTPLATEFRRISADFRYGRPLADALAAAQQRLQTDSFVLFATALQVAIMRGGRVNEALTRISHSLQENQRLERKIQADTAGGRRAVQILAGFPVAFLLLLQPVAPYEVGHLYTTLVGQFVLAGAIMIDYFGVRMALRLVRLNF